MKKDILDYHSQKDYSAAQIKKKVRKIIKKK
jgi:hypothetical protein